MMEDPYSILGVSKNASDSDIKTTYRKLAKQYHPDAHPGDEQALKKFQAINAAYDLLKDKNQRARYDQHVHWNNRGGAGQDFTARSAGRQAGFDMFGEWEAILKNHGIFGDAAREYRSSQPPPRPRKQDITYPLEIDFADAILGTKTDMALGDGRVVTVKIPSGAETGMRLRLKGQGKQGGDAYAELTVRSDKKMQREGRNIVIQLPISIDEAVLGGKVQVETLTGVIELMIPPYSSSGDRLRLKGRGVKASAKKLAGDFLIELKIIMPEYPDSQLEEAIQRWKKLGAPHNPREN